MKDEGKFFQCECGGEILSVHYWEWDDDPVREFDFSIFRDYIYHSSLLNRIKYARERNI